MPRRLAVLTVLVAACAEPPQAHNGPPEDGPALEGEQLGNGVLVDDPVDPSELIDAAVPDAPPVDAPPVDAPPVDAFEGPCPTDALGVLEGTAEGRINGSSGHEVLAAVTWTPVETIGCVDRYQPSGTVTYRAWGPQDCNFTFTPATGEIEPGDGELLVDRTTAPPTYRMRGESHYLATQVCDGAPTPPWLHGGEWTDHTGTFDGDLTAGYGPVGSELTMSWRFVRGGAAFTPPPGGTCSEPPSEQWATSTQWGAHAQLIWSRTATVGCVDTYTPAGTVWRATSCTPQPATATVEPDDGILQIDRSTDPPTFHITGTTDLPTFNCPGGIATGQTAPVRWAAFAAEFDGDRFGASLVPSGVSWQLTRL